MCASIASKHWTTAVVAKFITAAAGHMGTTFASLNNSAAFGAGLVALFPDESEGLLVVFRGTCAFSLVF